jgi:TorA maturation chaperone TorD
MNSDEIRALGFATMDDGEELARAEIYGLLARLWFSPPDDELMQQFKVAVTQAPQSGAFLEAPWEALVATFRELDRSAIAAEYDALFHGVGRPEVFLYGSYHLSGYLNDKPLAALRVDLADLGLARDDARGETEDHVAFVFEVMRYLIAGDDVAVCNLERQRRFFRSHVQTWVEAMCDSVNAQPRARAYARVADFTRAFIQVETQGFDLLEA